MTPRARRGMTLMELVVGITITGIMAAAGAGAFSSIIDHRKVIREATVSTERAAALRDQIRIWIASGTIQIQQGGGPRGLRPAQSTFLSLTPGTSVSGRTTYGSATATPTSAVASGDEFIFTTTAENPSLLPNVRIRMYIDADPNTPETGLTMEYQPNIQQPIVRRQLDSAIGVMKVELLDRRTGRWFPGSEGATISPRAARLTLLPGEHMTIPPMLSVPMIFVFGGARDAINLDLQLGR